MDTTVVLSIGNTDDKLTQKVWHNYVTAFKMEIESFGDLVFFGFTESSSERQSCSAILVIPDSLWISMQWKSLDEWVENVIRPGLQMLTKRYKQDSIAMLVGTTEFVNGEEPSNV